MGTETINSNITNDNVTSVNPVVSLNESVETCQAGKSFFEEKYERDIILFLYVAILIVAVFGNLLIIILILCTKFLRTVVNLLILNQCLSDILMVCLNIPYIYLANVHSGSWEAGNAFCKLGTFSMNSSNLLSVLTMISLGLHRYRAVIHPLSKKLSKRVVTIFCFAIWVGAFLFGLPIFLNSRIYSWCNNVKICVIMWNSETEMVSYLISSQFLEYFIPIALLSVTYGKVCRVIWYGRAPGQSSEQQDKPILEKKKKSVKMLMTIVILYIICFLPWNVYKAFEMYGVWNFDTSKIVKFRVSAHIIAMSNFCYNPVVYFVMSSKFRAAISSRIPKTLCDKMKICGKIYTDTSCKASDDSAHKGKPGNKKSTDITPSNSSDKQNKEF